MLNNLVRIRGDFIRKEFLSFFSRAHRQQKMMERFWTQVRCNRLLVMSSSIASSRVTRSDIFLVDVTLRQFVAKAIGRQT